MRVSLARRQIVRRKFLHLAVGAAVLPTASHLAKAEAFPVRPVHIVVGFPAGGAGDIVARLIGQPLAQRIGQSVVVDDRPGAGGSIGAEAVVRAPPDGYTLIMGGGNNAINTTLYKNLPFDFTRDIAMVAGIMRSPLIMVANPSLPAKDVTEFIAYARANPGKINMASGGNGTSSHLAGELFKMITGVAIVHVPYRGQEPALADLVAGRVQVMFAQLPSAIGFIPGGRLRALAVTTAARWPALPEIPAVADAVPGYEVSAWFGLGAPKATPAAIIAKLNTETNASLADRALVARMAELGGAPMVFSPSELDAFVAAETDKWAKVVKFSGAKVD
jgi:tripartite-type tricarboxylate transporter receptor subunit TctC